MMTAQRIQQEYEEDLEDFAKCQNPKHHFHKNFNEGMLKLLLNFKVDPNFNYKGNFEESSRSTLKQSGNIKHKSKAVSLHPSHINLPELMSVQPYHEDCEDDVS